MSAPSMARELAPGYSVLSGSYTATPASYTSLRRLLLLLAAGLTVVVGAMTAASLLTAPPPVRYACPPECGQPPTGVPVQANPRFTAADGSFSVAYPAPGSAYEITKEDDGVSAEFTAGDGGAMELFGVPANGRTAEQVVDDLLHEKQPDATVAYVLPNATVGYQLGYGAVLDVYPQTSTGVARRNRIVVMAAVKNDLTLIGAAIGPYRPFRPGDGPSLPSGANLQLAEDLGKYINSFQWKGDPPR
ncbi:hypothetical protein ORI20_14525 [Mycobacterium sp. CVI_P3]|uniref:Uncharacterized protein n=1 Tax=Mycobacterium pinniadriaticum TaxID=2994102 RepID=A0ABT3SEH8_9MYCO|nr:hypothetical protein [Mycobacterium pinniadriaticum]MCX2931495.1 hypothetical protein [Mycobacterium pinniadriaticum]MCX2937919.1 hypothetical protein [Mycobacterium pinniadriaticum]